MPTINLTTAISTLRTTTGCTAAAARSALATLQAHVRPRQWIEDNGDTYRAILVHGPVRLTRSLRTRSRVLALRRRGAAFAAMRRELARGTV